MWRGGDGIGDDVIYVLALSLAALLIYGGSFAIRDWRYKLDRGPKPPDSGVLIVWILVGMVLVASLLTVE